MEYNRKYKYVACDNPDVIAYGYQSERGMILIKKGDVFEEGMNTCNGNKYKLSKDDADIANSSIIDSQAFDHLTESVLMELVSISKP